MQQKLINIDPEIMGGTPIFNGTRVPVHSLFDWLETETLEEFLENFPAVTNEQAVAVLKLAENFATNERLLNEAAP